MNLYAAVDNIANRAPAQAAVGPFIGAAPLGINPALYDVLGRTFRVGARLESGEWVVPPRLEERGGIFSFLGIAPTHRRPRAAATTQRPWARLNPADVQRAFVPATMMR